MEKYGKFHVGQRVRTTCKYKCKFGKSFEGIIESFCYDKNCNYLGICIYDDCNNFHVVYGFVHVCLAYLEPVCPEQRKCKFGIGDNVETKFGHDTILTKKYRGEIINYSWIENVSGGYYLITLINECGDIESIDESYLKLDNCPLHLKNKEKDYFKEIDDIKHEISRLSSDVWDLKYYYNSMNRFSRKDDDELSPTEGCICFIILFAVLILATYGSLKFVGLI